MKTQQFLSFSAFNYMILMGIYLSVLFSSAFTWILVALLAYIAALQFKELEK